MPHNLDFVKLWVDLLIKILHDIESVGLEGLGSDGGSLLRNHEGWISRETS